MLAWRSESALRLRHIGDRERLHELVRDALPIAFAEARGEVELELWRKSVDRLVDDALDAVESLLAFGLGSGDGATSSRVVSRLRRHTGPAGTHR